MFATNHELRRPVPALAIGNVGKRGDAAAGGHVIGGHAAGEHATGGCCNANHATQKSRSHDTSRIAWAKLMARVGEEFHLECPNYGGDIRLIAFITDPGPIRKILTHLGEPLISSGSVADVPLAGLSLIPYPLSLVRTPPEGPHAAGGNTRISSPTLPDHPR